MAERAEQAGDPPGSLGADGWPQVVARAIHTAEVFGAEELPPVQVGPDTVGGVRWRLAVGAHAGARLVSALWVEATTRGLAVPAQVDAATGPLSDWSKELAAGDILHSTGQRGPSRQGQGAAGWDVLVARAIHTAQVFGPAGVPSNGLDPGEGSVWWELALGAHGAARLLSALWVEAVVLDMPVPDEVAAAIHGLWAWSRDLAAMS